MDNHKICIICEGNEEYEYLKRLKDLKVWNEQYDISLVNAGGNGNIPARYQDRYQNGSDELVLVFCDTENKPHGQYEDIKSPTKPVNAPLIQKYTGVENYKRRTDQIADVMKHISVDNYGGYGSEN